MHTYLQTALANNFILKVDTLDRDAQIVFSQNFEFSLQRTACVSLRENSTLYKHIYPLFMVP